MKKFLLIALALILLIVPCVKATATGTIRIYPAWPDWQASPATFKISVEGEEADPTYDPNILLVMTEACWTGLTGNVTVDWSGGSVEFMNTNFTAVTDNGAYVPPSGTTQGARYTVGSLKDHLSYGLSEPISSTETIYWALAPFLSGPITGTNQTFTVTLPSANQRMLIYALGKTEGSDLFDIIFDRKVPPTIPGFMVPELGPILLILASFGALALYAVKRKKYFARARFPLAN